MHTHRHPQARRLLAGLVAIATLAAVAGACSGGPAGTPSPTGAPTPTPLPSSLPSSPPPATPGDGMSVPQGILDAVLADAAGRTGVPVGSITIITAKGVTWPNGALGCPQPGMMYTEMIEPGYQVVVDAGGRQLDYRIGSRGVPALCENPPAAG